jgi:hypothetical protein
LCGYSFDRKHDLSRHIKGHTNTRNYRCFACFLHGRESAFKRKDAAMRHIRSHQERPGVFDPELLAESRRLVTHADTDVRMVFSLEDEDEVRELNRRMYEDNELEDDD